jgi:hypothetical protein
MVVEDVVDGSVGVPPTYETPDTLEFTSLIVNAERTTPTSNIQKTKSISPSGGESFKGKSC